MSTTAKHLLTFVCGIYVKSALACHTVSHYEVSWLFLHSFPYNAYKLVPSNLRTVWTQLFPSFDEILNFSLKADVRCLHSIITDHSKRRSLPHDIRTDAKKRFTYAFQWWSPCCTNFWNWNQWMLLLLCKWSGQVDATGGESQTSATVGRFHGQSSIHIK